MTLTNKQETWLLNHFRHTKNDLIAEKLGISHSSLHRFARKYGLKKTKCFQSKCQRVATMAAWESNKRNNWPPKGYKIPKSAEYRFKEGVTPEQRLGKKRNAERIEKSAQSRRKTVAAEKRRVLFGLPQKTKLKVVTAPKGKSAYRYNLKKRGYIVPRAARIIYYDENTHRSPIVEQNAYNKYRFTFQELK